MPVVIPPWNSRGVIPPVSGHATSAERAPYEVGLADLVRRFAVTPERSQVLEGFLKYRARLHAVGLVKGFQWLDGSFIENIELLEKRSPKDIDVVTFYKLPKQQSQRKIQKKAPELFPATRAEHRALRSLLLVDAYTVDLDSKPTTLVRLASYWYSLWAHRRDQTWRGFLQVELDPAEDAAAAAELPKTSSTKGSP